MDEQREEQASILLGCQEEALDHDVALSLETLRPNGFDFVTTTLPHTTSTTAIRSDVTLVPGKWWRTSVVGVCPSSIAEWSFYLPWAWHMNLPAVILPAYSADSGTTDQYATHLTSLALQCTKEADSIFQLWVPVSLRADAVRDWQRIAAISNFPSCVGVMIDFVLPEGGEVEAREQLSLLHNLIGCGPVRAFRLHTSLFKKNAGGFPTLLKVHQYLLELVLQRIGRTVKGLLCVDSEVENRTHFAQYIQHIRNRKQVVACLDTEEANKEADYLDVLQKPLQPLQDHLLFGTYEVFEADPVKYQRYQDAAREFLQSRVAGSTTYVLVVGAGRGPLVTAVLQAYRSLQPVTSLRIVAVEKNPSAVLYLQAKLKNDPLWIQHGVQVLKSDLRSLEHNFCQQVDLIVSELLGSFGCNEVSPECLNPLTKKCRPDVDRVVGVQTAFETPYVVRTHAVSQLHREQQCWLFRHPSSEDTGRAVRLQFKGEDRGAMECTSGYGARTQLKLSNPENPSTPWIVTGLLGTFVAQLSSQHAISIAPASFSVGMFSWFPLYFPLIRPLHVPPAATIEASIWRKVDESRVWYEWTVSVLDSMGMVLSISPLHNPQGRSSHVSL